MRKLKLDAVQKYKILRAFTVANEVLREIKRHKLDGSALSDMKELEGAVQVIESIYVTTSSK